MMPAVHVCPSVTVLFWRDSMRQLSDIVCHKHPFTLLPSATVRDACREMRDRRIGAILVTNEDGNRCSEADVGWRLSSCADGRRERYRRNRLAWRFSSAGRRETRRRAHALGALAVSWSALLTCINSSSSKALNLTLHFLVSRSFAYV